VGVDFAAVIGEALSDAAAAMTGAETLRLI